MTTSTVRCEACSGSGTDALGDLPCLGCAGYGYLPNPFRSWPHHLHLVGDDLSETHQ